MSARRRSSEGIGRFCERFHDVLMKDVVECQTANGGSYDDQSGVRGSSQTAVMAGSGRIGAACLPGDTGRRADGRRQHLGLLQEKCLARKRTGLVLQHGGRAIAAQAGSIASLAGNPLTRAIVVQCGRRTACAVREDPFLADEHLARTLAARAGKFPEIAQSASRLLPKLPETFMAGTGFHARKVGALLLDLSNLPAI